MVKIPLFYQKIVEKICVYQKMFVPLHSKNKRERRIASLYGADKTVKCAACNVGIAHCSDGAGDKTVNVAASKIYHTPPALLF